MTDADRFANGWLATRSVQLAHEGLRIEELAKKLDRVGSTPDAAERYQKAAATLNHAAALCPLEKASAAASDLAKQAEVFAASVFPDSSAKAVILYKQALTQFSKAVACCPTAHRDRDALESHASDIQVRIMYLESLAGAPTTVPIEDHIRIVTLTLEESSEQVQEAPQACAALRTSPDHMQESSEQVQEAPQASAALQTSPDHMQAALPEGWAAHADAAEGRTFYFNAASGVSQWDMPTQQTTQAAHLQAAVPEQLSGADLEYSLRPKPDFLQCAVDMEAAARDMENNGQCQQALVAFTDCLQLYALIQKREQNPRVKQSIRDRMAELLDRAEVLKAKNALMG